MTTSFTYQDIAAMDRKTRLHLINSISGIKPANLIGTCDKQGNENLAIFSSVVHLGSNPPLLGFILRPHTEFRRDTHRNIEETGYYTINHVSTELIKNAHYTSAKFEAGINEFERCGLKQVYLQDFPAPFVAAAPVKIGLKLQNQIPIPDNNTTLVIGRIELLEVPEFVMKANGKLNLEQLQTAGISGLNTYYKMERLEEFPYVRTEEVPNFGL